MSVSPPPPPSLPGIKPLDAPASTEDYSKPLPSVAIRSEALGFEVYMFSDGCYRAYVSDSNLWGKAWDSATLAVFEGFVMIDQHSL